jgi:hypothetical protein
VTPQVHEFVASGRTEPLAHELLREALSLRSSNPRSAFLIGYSAAEVGIKQHIASLVPDLRWFVREVPSPPIPKILAHLHELPPRSPDARLQKIDKAIRDEFESATRLRNALAHRGEAGELTLERVERFLRAARALLWILDARGGDLWALDYVGREPGLERCPPDPPSKRPQQKPSNKKERGTDHDDAQRQEPR